MPIARPRIRLALLALAVACAGRAAPLTPPAGTPPAAQAGRAVDAGPRASAPPAERPAVAPPAPPAGEPETNVRPGANAEYLRDDLEVNEWVTRFERAGRDIYDHRHELVAATGARPGSAVADVGAGTGLFTLLFAEKVGPTGRVYAVDLAPRFLAHIRSRAAAQGLTNVTTVRGGERSLGLPRGSVDVAFLCDVYHHFEYPRAMLRSIDEALRPDGTLVVIDFKRVRGESPDWVFKHVRAGQDVFTREIEAAGFEKTGELPLLHENYVLRFRKRVR
jgi:ubiquinone/menaquinone biosynthesis C-methylase UbiE